MNNKELIKQFVEYSYNKMSFLLPFIICLIWTSIFTVVAIALGTLEVIYFSLIVDVPLLPCVYIIVIR